MRRLAVAGGGTGGHLYPGIAVAREAMSKGAEVVFIGTESGIEAKVLPREGLKLRTIKAGKYMGMGALGKLRTACMTPGSVLSSMAILREFRPEAVMGVGGYASFPAVLAARLMGVPVVIQEQNAYPGLTNRTLGRFAAKVALGFAEAARFFPEGRTEFTGNPIRMELFGADRAEALGSLGLDEGRLTVLVFGGSAGAHTINRAAIGALPLLGELKGRVQFIHQTGGKDLEMVEAAYRDNGFRAVASAFIYDMRSAYACADLAVCRSGALTLAELTALGRPAVLVPYPFAASNHQEINARAMESKGAAVVIKDGEATPARLAAELTRLIGDRALLARMAGASHEMGRPDAAADVLRLIEDAAKAA